MIDPPNQVRKVNARALRHRMARAVLAGQSRREMARMFDVGARCMIKLIQRVWLIQAARLGGAKGRQRREQTCRNHSRVRGLKKYNPANFRAINPEDFRVPARTVYSSGRKYEIRAPVNWLSKRRSALAKVMREYRCGRAGASKPRPKWRASRPGNLDLGT
jgi:hypothetical protein